MPAMEIVNLSNVTSSKYWQKCFSTGNLECNYRLVVTNQEYGSSRVPTLGKIGSQGDAWFSKNTKTKSFGVCGTILKRITKILWHNKDQW